jgi:hypothetical protein
MVGTGVIATVVATALLPLRLLDEAVCTTSLANARAAVEDARRRALALAALKELERRAA